MSKQWQIRRGTSAENNGFTGAQGELTMDTDKNQIRLHDGITQGGIRFLGLSDVLTAVMPDYSRMQTDLTSPFTAPLDGWFFCNLNNQGTHISVNDVLVIDHGDDSGNEGPTTIPVSKGDIVTFGNTFSPRFAPCKGN